MSNVQQEEYLRMGSIGMLLMIRESKLLIDLIQQILHNK